MLRQLFADFTSWSFHTVFLMDKVGTGISFCQSSVCSPDLPTVQQCSILMCMFIQLVSEEQSGENLRSSSKPKIYGYRRSYDGKYFYGVFGFVFKC
jgi:hypothetical protein